MWIPVGPWVSLTPGVPVRATSTRTDGLAVDAILEAHAVLFQQCPGNLGMIYVFNSATGDKNGITTGTCGMIATPTYNNNGYAIILPHASVGIPGTANALNAASYWIDCDHAGDKCAVSYVLL
jgi:hypothetical protein